MKNTDTNALEIARRGGAVAAGDWKTGTGNYVKKRPIPALCMELDAARIDTLKGRSLAAARRLLKKRPKVRKLIVIRDWRTLNKLNVETAA